MAKITKEKYPGLIKSWSFSRYSDYCKCPAMAKYKYIDKIVNPDDQKSEALQRGARIHELAEGYLKGTIARLPKELKAFEDEFKKLRKQYKKKVSGKRRTGLTWLTVGCVLSSTVRTTKTTRLLL